MGIRFHCHECRHALHVKDFQAGKRGKCPACQIRFRIPMQDADTSLPLDEQSSLASEAGDVQVEDDEPQTGIPRPKEPISTLTRRPAAPVADPKPKPGTPLPPNKTSAKPDASQSWFVRPPSGGQYGPAPFSMIEEWIQQRRVTRDSLVWREGLEQWSAADLVFPELFPDRVVAPIEPTDSRKPPQPVSVTSGPILVPTGNETAIRLARQRKNKRSRQLMLVIALLGVAVALIIALVAVMLNQKPATNQVSMAQFQTVFYRSP